MFRKIVQTVAVFLLLSVMIAVMPSCTSRTDPSADSEISGTESPQQSTTNETEGAATTEGTEETEGAETTESTEKIPGTEETERVEETESVENPALDEDNLGEWN